MPMLEKIRYLNELQKNQWKKKEELQEIQDKKLRHIVDYSYRNVRFYRDLFNSANVKPSDIRTVEDISKLPVVDKKMIADAGANAYSSSTDINKCINIHTGGTTGYPLNIPRDSDGIDFAWAVDYRIIFNLGYKITQKQLSPISHLDDLNQKPPFIQKLGFFRRRDISLHLPPADKIKIINEYKPKLLWHWHATVLHECANYILSNPNALTFNPDTILTASEVLSDDCRKRVEEAFNMRPLDYYGAAETGPISWECKEHCGYHINSDCVVVEFLKDNEPVSPGKSGEIVVTNLFSKTLPFIRYNIKDDGIPTDDVCSCGRTLPLMKSIEGRICGFIVLKDGSLRSPIRLIVLLRDIDGILERKVIQEKVDKFTVLLVKSKTFSSDTINQIHDAIKKVVNDDDIDIDVKIVDNIKWSKSDKRRVVVSKVKGGEIN